MKSIYLAGPLGFSEIGNHGYEMLEQVLTPKFKVFNPFKESAELGDQIGALQQQLLTPGPVSAEQSFLTITTRIHEINQKIGQANADLIRQSDLVLAVLDSTDIDSGTAAEIGFAFGLGKKIFGYRGDFRDCGDNLGSVINLQVEYFILASGGTIYRSMEEVKALLTQA